MRLTRRSPRTSSGFSKAASLRPRRCAWWADAMSEGPSPELVALLAAQAGLERALKLFSDSVQAAAERVRGSKPTNQVDEEYPRQATRSPDSPGTTSSARTPTGGHVPRRARANGKRKNSKGSGRRGGATDRRPETDTPTSDESAV